MRETFRKLTIHAEVAIDIPLKISYGQARFLPRAVVIELSRDAGEQWQPHKVKASGPNVKKDGSTGDRTHENTYWWWGGSADWSGQSPPRWLVDLMSAELNELRAVAGGSDAAELERQVEQFEQVDEQLSSFQVADRLRARADELLGGPTRLRGGGDA
jgi:hypothetical protein